MPVTKSIPRRTPASRAGKDSSAPATPRKRESKARRGSGGEGHRPATAGPRVADDGTVRINLPGLELVRLAPTERRTLQRKAISWNYALRNRQRWTAQGDAAATQRREMREFGLELGLTPEHFEQMAKSGLVEVDLPWAGEAQDWELRILPWEFMLAAVTRDFRGARPFTVVRRLRVARKVRRHVAPTSWLQVVSAPGALADEYDFAGERRLLELSVQSFSGRLQLLKDPDPARLESEILSRKPDVIHLSGFDNHQGLALIDPHRDEEARDGYLLRSAGSEPVPVEAESLARSLTCAKGHEPVLISCNFSNSAARIAPLCVASGAGAVIGFQDSFADNLAELFYATLYQAWHLAGWRIVPAFQYAWQEVRRRNAPLQGSGVVLWSEESILGEAPQRQGAAPDVQQRIRERWRKQLKKPATALTVRDQLEVEVVPIPQLNYSILHNNGPIFERFRVSKKTPGIGRIDGLQVDVQLHVGTDSYPFRTLASIEETAPHVDLPDTIRISLATTLNRSIRESMHTSLFVEVSWNGTTLYRQTHRVTLLPVDEWRFDAENYRWLPSFVLPRDPAVLRVVDAAQRYLMALRDDATAGFDGYQSVEATKGRQVAPEDCVLVDMQVRAIWSALLYETPLSYINPPPTFTDESQRLRTPSDCIDGKRGTCIDLALLLASCLEYVEIYPAIVLLKTHAFPAYWRHDSFHEDFRKARTGTERVDMELERGRPSPASGQAFSWAFQPSQYREIVGEVQAGRLVPLETTLVTGRGSFSEAVADGVQNLASRREFESMLDVLLARSDRRSRVTPLPVRRGDP
ncbi:MAG: CHAT domain-containing protein [Betaproteobacteria bacterium]|nr:CHAT domain-containing protein [Betaproteobacteria bacterium]MDH5576879.1 CHAT domain-containing protein [Betaproteobacteria bacterium]